MLHRKRYLNNKKSIVTVRLFAIVTKHPFNSLTANEELLFGYSKKVTILAVKGLNYQKSMKPVTFFHNFHIFV